MTKIGEDFCPFNNDWVSHQPTGRKNKRIRIDKKKEPDETEKK
jgi:hypothetical protein